MPTDPTIADLIAFIDRSTGGNARAGHLLALARHVAAHAEGES